MQQSKVTEKIGEFQKIIDNDSDTGMCLENTLKFFEIRRIFGQFESIKQKGVNSNIELYPCSKNNCTPEEVQISL